LKLDELAAYTDYTLTAAIRRQEAELEERATRRRI